jgi:hypothetical protein
METHSYSNIYLLFFTAYVVVTDSRMLRKILLQFSWLKCEDGLYV